MRLREAERLKYQRNGKTDKESIITFFGEEIFQQINDRKDVYIASPFLPGRMPEGPFSQFYYGTTPVPLHKADFDNRPQAADATRRVISHCIPSGILLKATEAWRQT